MLILINSFLRESGTGNQYLDIQCQNYIFYLKNVFFMQEGDLFKKGKGRSENFTGILIFFFAAFFKKCLKVL